MDGARDHLLASAIFAQDENRVRAISCSRDDPVELLHFERATDDAGSLFRPFSRSSRFSDFRFKRLATRYTSSPTLSTLKG